MTAPRTVQRYAAILCLAAGFLLPLLTLSPGFTAAVPVTLWAIAQAVGIAWVCSGAWAQTERWAVRLQTTFVGIAIITVIVAQQDAELAAAGLLIFLGAALLLQLAHLTRQALTSIQGGLVTVRGFARTEAARQGLLFATFAAPLTLTFAPNIIGLGFLAVSTFLICDIVVRRARRRLERGLAREAAGE